MLLNITKLISSTPSQGLTNLNNLKILVKLMQDIIIDYYESFVNVIDTPLIFTVLTDTSSI